MGFPKPTPALTDADARTDQCAALWVTTQRKRCGHRQSRSAGAKRVAERDGAKHRGINAAPAARQHCGNSGAHLAAIGQIGIQYYLSDADTSDIGDRIQWPGNAVKRHVKIARAARQRTRARQWHAIRKHRAVDT